MSGEETPLQSPPAELQMLVERLAQSEAALQAVLTDQIDAVIDPATATPILLRHAQETLRESEERFRLLIDGVKDFALFMLDPAGLVVGWNAAAERIFGYTAAAITGCHFSCFYPAAARAAASPELGLAEASEGRFEEETVCVRHDGSTFWADMVISPLLDPQGGRRGFAVVTRDITERRQADERTHFQARVLAEVQDAVIAVDSDSRVTYWNGAAERLYGIPAEQALGRPVEDATHARWLRLEDEQAAHVALMTAGLWHGESLHATKSGREITVESSVSVIHDAAGARNGTLAVIRDVTNRKALEEQLRHRALFDTLTGLPNRALFMDRLGRACSAARRYQSSVAVLFLDLDGFKFVNDSLGHAVGDELLTSVSHRLLDNLRMGDTAARYGGDEFTILLEDVAGRAEAVRVADRIIRDLHRPFLLNGRSRFITTSIGIALGKPSSDQAQPDRLIRHADIALHQAKIAGKAQACVFERGMARQAVERLELETDLRWAIERNEFRLHYQPIVGLNSGAVVGMEALVRWHHPRRGLVQPMEFIPLAEETGLIVPLGRWIIEEACRQASAWEAAGPDQPAPVVSTNLSVLQLQQPDLVEQIGAVLRRTGLDPGRLVLEITEGAAMHDAETTVATLHALKDLGMQLAIDDFGTGYSSLSYLRRFPLDTIKVDQSFVKTVGDDSASDTIVEGVVALAHALGLGVTAEGIEKPEQLARLQTLNCDYGQGFYFSHPLTNEAIPEFYLSQVPLSVR